MNTEREYVEFSRDLEDNPELRFNISSLYENKEDPPSFGDVEED